MKNTSNGTFFLIVFCAGPSNSVNIDRWLRSLRIKLSGSPIEIQKTQSAYRDWCFKGNSKEGIDRI